MARKPKKKPKKKPAEILVHLTRPGKNDEDLLMLGTDADRIKRLQGLGFIVASSYRLVRTAVGQVATTLPSSGVFACASSSLAKSPWIAQKE